MKSIPKPDRALLANFTTLDRPLVEDSFYVDKWGTWLSGYAPFYGPDGQRAGVIGVDIKAVKIKERERQILLVALVVFLFTIPVSALLGTFLGRRLSQPIITLKNAATRIASGDLEPPAGPAGADEIGDLAREFNSMARQLKKSHDELTRHRHGLEKMVAERSNELTVANRQLLQEIEDRRRAEVTLRYTLVFQEIITRLTARFIERGQTDEKINLALADIGRHAEVDRAYVFQLHEDGPLLYNTHEWCAEGIEPQIEKLQGVSVDEELPWFWRRLTERSVFHFPDVEALPPEAALEKEHFQWQGIKSLVVVPMISNGGLKGFLGLDSVQSAQSWSDEVISMLITAGRIIIGALERRKIERELMDSERRLADIIGLSARPGLGHRSDGRGHGLEPGLGKAHRSRGFGYFGAG